MRTTMAVVVAALFLGGGVLAACGDDGDAPTASEAWARPGAAGANTAIYMVVDGGSEDDTIVGAEVDPPVSADVQIHETVTETGDMESGDMDSGDMDSGDMDSGDDAPMMSMQEVESIEVPAGGSVALEPGGYHIMLFDLTEELVEGDTLDVTVVLGSGTELTATAEVRQS